MTGLSEKRDQVLLTIGSEIGLRERKMRFTQDHNPAFGAICRLEHPKCA